MFKGTTPTHTYEFPFNTDTIKTIQITYAQNGETILTKGNDDCVLSGYTASLELTQEETFLFASGAPVDIQVRIFTHGGDAIASTIMNVGCYACLSEDVLE